MTHPKKLSLFYFSGTGNTKVVCEQLANAIQKQPDQSVNLTSIESSAIDEVIEVAQSAEYIGIAFPIYGLGAPRNILEFSEQLAESLKEPKKIVILMTAGDIIGINHAASQTLIRYFEKKGHTVVYERIIVMGANFFLAYPTAFNKQLYEVSKLKTDHMASELMSGKIRRLTPSGMVKLTSRMVHLGESKQGAVMYGKALHSDASCTKCGLCVKKCPVGSLTLESQGVKGSKRCIMCMRCVYSCPSQSLRSKGMNFVILKEGYSLDAVIKFQTNDRPFVHENTRGFYKHFYNYIKDMSV